MAQGFGTETPPPTRTVTGHGDTAFTGDNTGAGGLVIVALVAVGVAGMVSGGFRRKPRVK